jgi:hypothetical protein
MTLRLDHTIVPAKDRRESAAFFAENLRPHREARERPLHAGADQRQPDLRLDGHLLEVMTVPETGS